jgi:ELWxxDGT repeat protein
MLASRSLASLSLTLFCAVALVPRLEWSSAQAPPLTNTLLADIRPGAAGTPVGTLHDFCASAAQYVLFAPPTISLGREPWVTDGTSAGTFLLADVAPGNPNGLALQLFGPHASAVGSISIFSGQANGHGHEPFRTDGTQAGTYLLADLVPGGTGSLPRYFVSLGGHVYFLATNGSGTHVYRTDGTAAGTSLEIDMQAQFGALLQYTSGLVAAEGRLWIWDSTSSGLGQHRLFVSDGTPAGTQFVRTFNGSIVSNSSSFGHGFGGRLYFAIAGSTATDRGVWVTDGTPAGTTRLWESPYTAWISHSATRALFACGSSSGAILDLVASDGTPQSNTVLSTYRFHLSPSPNERLDPEPLGAGVVFNGLKGGGSGGYELQYSDGTPAGTYQIADVEPGPVGSYPERLRAWNGRVFFSALTSANGRELWRTDGTAAGTQLAFEWTPGAGSTTFGYHPSFFGTPTGLVLGVDDGTHGIEPWVTDGTPGGTQLLVNTQPDPQASSGIDLVRRLDEIALFVANDGTHGRELWKSDGTSSGTQLVLDAAPGPQDGGPTSIATLAGRAYFDGGPPNDRELWVSDGTAAGTYELADLHPSGGSQPEQLLAAETQVFFVAFDPQYGYELRRTDGTSAGTTLPLDLVVYAPVWQSSLEQRPYLIATVEDRVYFSWFQYQLPGQPDSGWELFVSDGTAGGTKLVADLAPGGLSSEIAFAERVGDKLAFTYETPALGWELWITDGTPTGTRPLIDLRPGPLGSAAQNLVSHGDRMLFTASDGTTTYLDLWITDGTIAGTHKILPQSSVSQFLIPEWEAKGTLAWFRLGGANGPQELWRTDGTATGTWLVDSFTPVFEPGSPFVQHVPIGSVGKPGGQAYVKSTSALGAELWFADAGGAVLQLADTNPGGAGAQPRDALRIGSSLLFVASEPQHGEELHAIPFSSVPTWDALSYGTGCSNLSQPTIGVSGTLALGGSGSLDLAAAAPGSFAVAYISLAPAHVALGGGCTLLIAAPQLFGVASTNLQGAASKPVQVPNDPSLVGALLYYQWAVLETAGPLLGHAGLSDGLELLIGP